MAGTPTLVECRAEFARIKAGYIPVLENKCKIRHLWVAFTIQNTAVNKTLGGIDRILKYG